MNAHVYQTRFRRRTHQSFRHRRNPLSRRRLWAEWLEPRRMLSVMFVNDDAPGPIHDGTSWATAYTDLQVGLTAARSGDDIWVAEGTYKPTTTSNRNASFNLKTGVDLYGGFAGTETDLAERNWVAYVTTLSGDIGVTGNNADNSLHVVYASGVTGASLDGFVVTGGNANIGGSFYEYGGGILNIGSSPNLTNLTLRGNSAHYGAAIVNYNWSSPTLTNVTLTDNAATQQGGGMYNHLSSPTLTYVTFNSNSAGVHGGGIYNSASSSPTLTNATLVGNSAYYGGGIYNIGGTVALTGSFLSGNSASYTGGAIDNRGSMTITNSALTGNSAGWSSGAIWVSGTTSINASTIAGNSALEVGGINNEYGRYTVNISNSIVARNTTASGYAPDVANVVISSGNNLIGNTEDNWGWTASDLKNVDPLLVDAAGGDVRLRPGSPAIDRGTNDGAPLVDLDGRARPQDGDGNGSITTDIGAYEYPASAVLYVNDDATGLNTGTSWANAFTSLQSALSVANTDDEIWVAAGTYKPTTIDRSVSFNLKAGVDIYGGFAGTETDLAERDWVTYVTTLSGDIGTPDSNADNSYHVVYASGVTDATLDGFTITAGNANGVVSPHYHGGGVYNTSSSMALNNLTFSGNAARERGGGMFNSRSSPVITQVVFGNNSAAVGGGIFQEYSSPTLAGVTFNDNSANINGGGMYTYSGTPALLDVTFNGNRAEQRGGGMYNNASAPTLTNVTFSDNSARYAGGGICNDYASPALTGVTLRGNSADEGGGMWNYNYSSPALADVAFIGNSAKSGGGMCNLYYSSPVLANVTFSGNSAAGYAGGGMWNLYSSPTLDNVVFSGNSANWHGGGVFNSASSPKFANVILSDNSASQRGGGIYNTQSSPTLASVVFTSNTAPQGGGMYNDVNSAATLTNVGFYSNSATDDAGGMYNYQSSPTLMNVAFVGNTAATEGGALYNNQSSSPTLTNVTFTGNSAGSAGGAVYNYGVSSLHTVLALKNSILWGNTAPTARQIYNDPFSTTTVSFSDIEGGGFAGTGNLNSDPLFVRAPSVGADGTWGTADDDYGDLRLQANSPAIDAGNNSAVPLDTADLDSDGNLSEPVPLDLRLRPRFIDVGGVTDTGSGTPPIIDMGAYENRDNAILYVNDDATGANNGESWTDAFTTLQAALSEAIPGDDIWVAAGTYMPTDTTDRTVSFNLKTGVDLYGGFEGTETDLEQRDWVTYVTTLSGDIGTVSAAGDNSYHVVYASSVTDAALDGFTITAGNANGTISPHYNGGGMYNEQSSPTLANLTFTGNTTTLHGGGVYNGSSSPTLTNVTFSSNFTGSHGGGMYNVHSSPVLTDVTFNRNSADYYGGGMFNYDYSSPMLTNVNFEENSAYYGGGMCNYWYSSPTLSNVRLSSNSATWGGGMSNQSSSSPTLATVTFTENSAYHDGGGMYNYYSSPTLTDVTLSGNSADNGGGVYNNYYSSPTLTNVTLSGNSAYYGGGVYNNYYSSPTLTNVTFSGNSASYYGGGMYNQTYSSPTLTNVTFSGNSASYGGGVFNNIYSSPTLTNVTLSGNSAYYGGGVFNNYYSSPTLTNVTLSGNSAYYGGGGIYSNYYCSPTLTNGIVWGNTASTAPQIYDDPSSTTAVSYSLVQGGGFAGTGNLSTDPLFVRAPSAGPDGTWGTADDDYGDLRLQPTSPAIDAGNNYAVPADTADLDGDGNTSEPLPLDLDLLPRFVDIASVPDTGLGTRPIVDMGAYELPRRPMVEFAAATFTTDESAGTSEVITLMRDTNEGVTTALVTITGGTASAPSDYNASAFPLMVTFNDGEWTKTVALPITDNDVAEASETVVMGVEVIVNGELGTQTTTELSIHDDDPATFQINDVLVNETAGTATFTVTVSNPLDIAVQIAVTYTDVTAKNLLDYDGSADYITFPAYSTAARTVTVAIVNDNRGELTETFTASLSTATPLADRDVSLVDTGTCTITDQDPLLAVEGGTLVPGRNLVTVTRATPGNVIVFATGTVAGPGYVKQYGVTLDIANPSLVAMAVVAANGTAKAYITVPATGNFLVQGFERSGAKGVTNLITRPSTLLLAAGRAAVVDQAFAKLASALPKSALVRSGELAGVSAAVRQTAQDLLVLSRPVTRVIQPAESVRLPITAEARRIGIEEVFRHRPSRRTDLSEHFELLAGELA